MNKLMLKDFYLEFAGKKVKAEVPGDITIDLFHAGMVSDPYIAENYKESSWVGRTDFDYVSEFDVSKELLDHDRVVLCFKGIDLFAKIYLNDVFLGETKNAFLAYFYEVKEHLKEKGNILRIKMTSTLNVMDEINTDGYGGVFNVPRIFVRKPQCHFGWDWAPKICAYGIIDDVYLEGRNKYEIVDVHIISDSNGKAIFNVEVNYDNKDLFGPNEIILEKGVENDDDTLIFHIGKTPFKKDYETYSLPLMGKKNFLAHEAYEYELWWPTGYGEQPLYFYKIELSRGGKIISTKEGRFAYRSVKIVEEPKDTNLIGMDFYINDKKIYLRGSNWIPPECFTGVMKDEKYVETISLAKKMNLNILRVWGGGSYEKDIFFSLCDEAGILVWQDIIFACADIPEDDKEFVDNVLEEVEYQVKRLRNHPSLIYWCGGNEKTGCYGNAITHGDFLVNVLLNGLITHLDPTRPYRRQSPHSWSDIGNDPTSGDSHYGCFEMSLVEGMDTYRKRLSKKVVPFVSESALMGPSSEETLRKIFPKDHLWPMDEMWKDRFMENPYGSVPLDFPHREMFYAENLYGKVEGLSDFISKAMCAQAEAARAECEYSRAHTSFTGAWLNWMFNDIWPSGTWSTIDYYLEPKQIYYQLRKSFNPFLVSFYEDNEGKTHLFVDNQTFSIYEGQIDYGVKKYDGTIIEEGSIKVEVDQNGFDMILGEYEEEGTYLYVKYKDDGKKKTYLYSPTMYRNIKVDNAFKVSFTIENDHKVILHVKAESFVKSLFIHFKDNYKYLYSDNYLDLEKGQEEDVVIESKEVIDISSIRFATLG